MQALKRVKEISNLARGSKAWCRAKSSFAASVPCDAPVVKKTGKRLPIGKRRAMVKTFVDRYQGENSGKFPTVSHAMKEVGGSYYVVRKIMQELKYNSKSSSSNAGKEVLSETGVSRYLSSGSKSEADEYKPSSETSSLMNTEDVKEEEHYEFPLDINGAKSKSEFLQPLSEVSCSENPRIVAEQLTCGSVLEVDGSESKIDNYQPSLEYLLPKKAENTQEEESNQCIQQPLPEVSSGKKSEDAREETCCESLLDVDNSKSKIEEHQPSHEYSVPKLPENSKEEKSNQELLLDLNGSESKTEFRQPLSEVSCSENPKNVAEQLICGSVLEVDGSESKIDNDQPSPKYLPPKKAENILEEEPNQCIQQPLPEVSSAMKFEDAKEETRCESVLDVNNSESKKEEHQPSHEYVIPKIPENSKEVKPDQVAVDIDGSESIAEERRKSMGELSEKQALEKIQIKSSIWGTLKSVAEDFFSIWRKR